jgi:site-specific DNA-methyltransferase (adenine-specific)
MVLEMNKLYNMDCMDGMKQFPDKYFELAIVDPPYRDENQPTKDMRASGSMKSLEGRPTEEYWQELYRVSVNQIIWGANNFQLPQFKGFVVWEKGIPEKFTMSMSEIASLSEGLGTISKIYKCRASGQGDRIHPTQKPVALYEWLLRNYAKEGNKILDTHVGSASSLIACHNMGFDYIGFELDKDYWKAATERLEAVKSQTTLWESIG